MSAAAEVHSGAGEASISPSRTKQQKATKMGQFYASTEHGTKHSDVHIALIRDGTK